MTPTKEQLADPAWWKANAPDWAGVLLKSRNTGQYAWAGSLKNGSRFSLLDHAESHNTPLRSNIRLAREAWDLVPKPSAVQWNGPQDGLPPVGTKFELLYSSIHGTYATVEAIAHRDGGVVICFLSTPDGVRDGEYQLEHNLTEVTSGYPHARLEETPEQKAARERTEAIDRIKEIICRDGAFDLLDPEVGAAAWALYNNGLRFTEKP